MKSRGHSSMSFDESSIPISVSSATASSGGTSTSSNSKIKQQPQQKGASALMPIPSHARTASSPAQLLDVSSYSAPQPKRTDSLDVESRYQYKSFLLDRMNSTESPKRTSSDTSDKYSKRSLSNASDKSQRRGTDDGRSSRTPSERSFILHTPDTPKGLTATPELLAELLKGSSEKLAAEQASTAVAAQSQSPLGHGSNLPVQLLNQLVSTLFP